MSLPAVDAVDVAVLAGTALEAAGVRYFLGGSLASSMQGEPRSTNDVDFVVEMAAWHAARFTAALGPEFSVDEPALRSSLAIGQSANVFYLPLFMKIDLIPRGTTRFDDSEFERRTRIVPPSPPFHSPSKPRIAQDVALSAPSGLERQTSPAAPPWRLVTAQQSHRRSARRPRRSR